ncbi:hypothetical protein KSP39_PZI016901 [Platanthera zijinensis]|uniref:Integrase catalytic domain-containing protein n=1 Tax=Platanthera zijinensis TaxID=2320716 RepID=A0AAP0B631_9ASPA
MADELFRGSFSGYSSTWNSMRCNDGLFSCSAAANDDGDAGGSFGYFPATTDIIFDQLSRYKSSSFDDISPLFSTPAIDWFQSFLGSPDTNNFYADFLHERPATEQCSQVEDISRGSLMLLSQDQNVTGSIMDGHDHNSYNIPSPLEHFSSDGSLRWSTTATTSGTMRPPYVIINADPTEMVRKEKLGDRITALQQLVSPFGKNGVVERRNRTVMEMARTMLQHTNCPNNLWGEATATAVHILNRSPTKALDNETPYELIFNHKPSVAHLRTFGCIAFAHTTKPGRDKLVGGGIECVFTGYSSESKAYRLYDHKNKSIIISRDVTFHEHKSYNWATESTIGVGPSSLPVELGVPPYYIHCNEAIPIPPEPQLEHVSPVPSDICQETYDNSI